MKTWKIETSSIKTGFKKLDKVNRISPAGERFCCPVCTIKEIKRLAEEPDDNYYEILKLVYHMMMDKHIKNTMEIIPEVKTVEKILLDKTEDWVEKLFLRLYNMEMLYTKLTHKEWEDDFHKHPERKRM